MYVSDVLKKIKEVSASMDMPIRVDTTIPRLEDTFWVNIIGRGYPVPNNTFRWCTDKMKIKPTSRFLTDKVAENGEAIILIGTRSSESANRARSIKKHEIRGKRLTKHPHNPNTYVYSPIKDLMLEEVWYIINTMTSLWGADNSQLFQIYMDASADDYECPTVVTDKSHTSCGQSRFGCWTCTVIKEDKSLTALVNNGQTWLKPLLDLRRNMIEERNKSENRLPIRRNFQSAVNADGDNLGTYTPEYRVQLLKQILNAQRTVQKEKPDIELITNQELVAIQVIWHRDAAYYNLKFPETVSYIYNKIYDKEIEMEKHAKKIQKEKDLLKSVCKDEPADYDLISELLTLQRNKALLNRKRGLKDDIERVIEKYLNQPV
jgi:DNA sulfur modification protein DndC